MMDYYNVCKYYWTIACLGLFLLSVGCTQEDSDGIRKTYINPASGYSQVVGVQTEHAKTLYVSGQIGEGEDLTTQMRSALENLRLQLEAGGATYDDIIKMNTYIVDYRPSFLDTFRLIRKEIMGNEDMPASTLVGVQSLARTEWLIEIEAVAVVESDND